MKGMMSSITDINSYFSKLSFENRVSSFSLHVIGWFIKISNSRNVSLLLFAKYDSMIIDDNSWIMECLFVFLSLKNGRDDNHIVFPGKLLQHLSWLTINWLRKLYPRISLTSAHEKWSSPYLLKTKYINFFESGNLHNILNSIEDCFLLFCYWFISR